MRLTNQNRRDVAGKICVEKFSKRIETARKKVEDLADDEFQKAFGAWTKHVGNWVPMFSGDSRTKATVEFPTGVFCVPLDALIIPPRKTRWDFSPGKQKQLVIEFSSKLKYGDSYYNIRKTMSMIDVNVAINEYCNVHDNQEKVFDEVVSFLSQFGTYKKALAEWPDLGRYLQDRIAHKRDNDKSAALIKTGNDLGKFLSSVT